MLTKVPRPCSRKMGTTARIVDVTHQIGIDDPGMRLDRRFLEQSYSRDTDIAEPEIDLPKLGQGAFGQCLTCAESVTSVCTTPRPHGIGVRPIRGQWFRALRAKASTARCEANGGSLPDPARCACNHDVATAWVTARFFL